MTLKSAQGSVSWVLSSPGLIQTELDEVERQWHNHRIRRVGNLESPPGRPNVLFFSPELTGGIECSYPDAQLDVRLAQTYVRSPSLLPCSEVPAQVCDNTTQLSQNTDHAKRLFLLLQTVTVYGMDNTKNCLQHLLSINARGQMTRKKSDNNFKTLYLHISQILQIFVKVFEIFQTYVEQF